MSARINSISIEPFLLLLVGTVGIATLLPARGSAVAVAEDVTFFAIVLLFFLHGAKLSRAAMLAGLGAWRIHALAFAATFLLFPLVGLGAAALGQHALNPALATGVLFLTLLPSTVQSSIAFTSIAGGNVPAAICSASLSNIAGVVLTPVLAALLIGGAGGLGAPGAAMETVALQLLLPFVAGHLSRPLTAGFVVRHRALVARVDRGSILLVVYTAFGAAVVQGLWARLSLRDLAAVLALDALILGVVMLLVAAAAKRLAFARADAITTLFCGSKKSLASGVPMAVALFPAGLVGPVILPLMIFHQMQLMLCAVLAARFARGEPSGLAPEPAQV